MPDSGGKTLSIPAHRRMIILGWRGMVGSVLMNRMIEEGDFAGLDATFFTTSQVGQPGPDVGQGSAPLKDASSIEELSKMQVIVTCQGGDYTNHVHAQLRAAGWKGYWIDAASALRMAGDSVIILDPVNRDVINRSLRRGVKDYIGGNCTVSLMLMGLVGLFRKGWVEWMSTMTYQSASGAGAANMQELVAQMGFVTQGLSPATAALELDRQVAARLASPDLPTTAFGAPLAASLIPWIDKAMESGQTREEWKGQVETNKILRTRKTIPVDGQCVRVGAMRCHSQAITIKLKKDIPLPDLEAEVLGAHEWVSLVANNKADTLAKLTPAAVSGSLNVPVGRFRKMTIGPKFVTCFTVGDQLLWGAAEPLRRMLLILRKKI
ncbi:MAG: aspartate-semialdehyde dehydrogenase [Kiritimatiellia bacterium]